MRDKFGQSPHSVTWIRDKSIKLQRNKSVVLSSGTRTLRLNFLTKNHSIAMCTFQLEFNRSGYQNCNWRLLTQKLPRECTWSFNIQGSPSEAKYFIPKISLSFCQSTQKYRQRLSVYPKITPNLQEFLEIIWYSQLQTRTWWSEGNNFKRVVAKVLLC